MLATYWPVLNYLQMTRHLEQEKIRLLYTSAAPVVYFSLLVAFIAALFLLSAVSYKLILIWLVLNIILHIFRKRLLTTHLAKIAQNQFNDFERAANEFRFYSLLNGLLWGMTAVFLFPKLSPGYFDIIFILHGGYLITAVAATACYDLRAFYYFTFSSSALFATGIAINGGLSYWPHIVLACLYPFIISSFAIRFNNVMSEQILLSFQNIELMTDLRNQRDRAEQAMLSKNRFLAAASHDLRQPVHALGLFVSSLEPQIKTPESKELVQKIKQTSGALGGLFHGLLDISKLDANVVENTPVHVKLDSLLTAYQAEYSTLALEKGIKFSIEISENPVAYIDPALLDRIIRNLISNAINYTDVGEVKLVVTSTATARIKLSVEDTGKGIPQEELENIFSEYHQLENPERDRQKGLGLGLAIVRRLCSLMDIEITVESSLDNGSAFSLLLPMGESKLTKQTASPSVKTDCEGMIIVVVDDEKDILLGMGSVLKQWGCNPILADSGSEAMSKLRMNAAPDVIIADFRLREHESGIDVVNNIRDEFNLDIPAILITGDTSPDRLQQAADSFVQVLHKPVDPDKLKEILSSVTLVRQVSFR